MQLRPYQKSACIEIEKTLAGEPANHLVVMATGAGKTFTFGHTAKHFVAKTGRTVLILTHTRELISQTAREIRRIAPKLKVGVEANIKQAERNCDIVIGSVPTVGHESSERLGWISPGLIIVDEAHHAPADTFLRAIHKYGENAHVLGFTATPVRLDRQSVVGTGAAFEGVIFRYDLADAVNDGWLCDLRGYCVKTNVNLDKVRVSAGDFSTSDLDRTVNVEGRTAAAFKAWQIQASDRKTICFCVTVEHAQNVAAFFRSQGVNATALTGEMRDKERDQIRDGYLGGDIQVITTVGVISEGFNAPETSCILMLRPTKSFALYSQMIGRGTRAVTEAINSLPTPVERKRAIACSTKPDCAVIDVVDVTWCHDLATVASLAGLPCRTNLNGSRFSEATRLATEIGNATGMEGLNLTFDELKIFLQERRLLPQEVLETEFVAGGQRFWPFEGRMLTLRKIATLTGVPYNRLNGRINQGWSIERAVKEPVHGKPEGSRRRRINTIERRTISGQVTAPLYDKVIKASGGSSLTIVMHAAFLALLERMERNVEYGGPGAIMSLLRACRERGFMERNDWVKPSWILKACQPSQEYTVLVSKLDVETGQALIALPEDCTRRFDAHIVDPLVFEPSNPYAKALYYQEPINVMARPEIIEGKRMSLHISGVSSESDSGSNSGLAEITERV